MRPRERFFLFLGALALALFASRWIPAPGYMDAEYYFATGRAVAAGEGFQERFLWNYLDDPAGLPHPSHAYWMPLPSLLAALGIALFGPSFSGARAFFLLAAAALPLLAADRAFDLTSDRRMAWAAGLLALAPGFFSPYLLTTDSFSPYAVLGSLTLAALASHRTQLLAWIGAGMLTGLCHLTRADGVLLLPLALISAWTLGVGGLRRAMAVVAGYGAVMVPWLARNVATFGSLMPVGQSRALWLLEYNDLFSYPASLLTSDRWIQAGWGPLLSARGQALGANLLSLWAVNGLIFLLPWMVLGAWRLRHRRLVRLNAAYLLLLLVVMTLAFPFPGARGGYFHSSVAAMPVLWAAVPSGLTAFLDWGHRVRRWDPRLGARVLGAAGLLLAAALSVFQLWQRAVGPNPARPRWTESERAYGRAAQALASLGPPGGTVAVNNPVGFQLASARPAVVIPSGGPAALEAVVSAFGVEWVILDRNIPAGLEALLAGSVERPGLTRTLEYEDPDAGRMVFFRVSPPGEAGP